MACTVEKECTLIIVGKTGSGKSSLGNSLLCHTGPGNQPFEAKMWATSVTAHCKRRCAMLKDGNYLSIVDTPGLFDTSFSIEETKREIAKSVALCAPGPHAILFVLRIGRFTKEEIESVDTLMNMFGTKSINFFIIVFTGKDQLGGCSLDEFVEHSPKYLTDFVKDCNSRYVGIANDPSSPTHDRDVKDVMQLIYKTMKQNGNQNYSEEAFAEAERVIQAEIERKQQELIDEENRQREKRLEQDEIERKRRLEKEERERQKRLDKEERERQERLKEEERERKRKQKIEEEELEDKRRKLAKEDQERKERFEKELTERQERIQKEEKERKDRTEEEERERNRIRKLEEEELEKRRQRLEQDERDRKERFEKELVERQERIEKEEKKRKERLEEEEIERKRKQKIEEDERKRKEELEKEESKRKREREHERRLEEIERSQPKLREDIKQNIESDDEGVVGLLVSGVKKIGRAIFKGFKKIFSL